MSFTRLPSSVHTHGGLSNRLRKSTFVKHSEIPLIIAPPLLLPPGSFPCPLLLPSFLLSLPSSVFSSSLLFFFATSHRSLPQVSWWPPFGLLRSGHLRHVAWPPLRASGCGSGFPSCFLFVSVPLTWRTDGEAVLFSRSLSLARVACVERARLEIFGCTLDLDRTVRVQTSCLLT